MEAAQRQKYIVSARLDSEHYFRLKKLARNRAAVRPRSSGSLSGAGECVNGCVRNI